jgi:hypothetical protein
MEPDMIKATATRASNLHTCRCGARANGVGAVVNIHRPLAIVLLLFFATVAEGSRVGVYRAWESAQLRRATTELWTPADEDSLRIWVDANEGLWQDFEGTVAVEDGDNVSLWEDQSGNDADAIARAVNLESRPTFRATNFNGRASLVFADNRPTFGVSNQTWFNNVGPSLHVVAYRRTGTGNRSLFGNRTLTAGAQLRTTTTGGLWGNVGNDALEFSGLSTDTIYIISVERSSGGYSVWIDGSLVASLDQTVGYESTSQEFSIGSQGSDSERYEGDIAIQLHYEINSTAIRQRSEGYVAHKWGLEDNLPANHPYRNNPPTK